jgi:Na+/H+-dicarboxylate symporter
VFALLAGTFSKMAGDDAGAVLEIFRGLMWYGLTVILGLALVLFVIYPGIVVAFVRHISYAQFFKNLGPAQMLAFSTSSSAATLPVTMECVNENMRVSEKVSSFVLPIGATVNMDGTSLYQAVAVVFLAQFHAVDLSLAQQLTIITTATLASIGSAAVPSAGLVMLIIVLESVGLNPAWIAIIFPIDRILDMCRTVINVTGDATVSTLIAASENELDALPVK